MVVLWRAPLEHRGSRVTNYGPTHQKTTPRHRCQPSGIRYALRVSRLPPPPVDSRTKFLQIPCYKFVRLHEGDDTGRTTKTKFPREKGRGFEF